MSVLKSVTKNPNLNILKSVIKNYALSFNPLLIKDCRVYIDPSDTKTIQSTSGAVFQITNKANPTNYIEQPSAGARPTTGTRTVNGLNVLDYNGSSNYLRTVLGDNFSPLTNGISIVCVVQYDVNVTTLPIVSQTNNGGVGRDYLDVISQKVASIMGGTTRSGGSTTINTPLFLAMTCTAAGAMTLTIGNSNTDFTGVTVEGSFGRYYIGSNKVPNSFFDGVIGELAIYSRAVNSAEINQLKSYFNKKYNLGL